MSWPTIPLFLMATDYVSIRRVGPWTQGSSGGRVKTLGDPTEPLQCTIKPVGRSPSHHTANHRDMQRVKYLATFLFENPHVHMGDEIYWINEDMTLIVVETITFGATDKDSRFWGAYCEERPAV